MPDNRHKPGDENARGRKPGGKKPRPEGFRHNGPRPDGPRPDGPRPEGFRHNGSRPFGPRPDGPRPDGPRFEAPKSFGPRPGGPRPGGFGGPRAGGGYGGPRPGGPGFRGPRPGAPDGRSAGRDAETPGRDAPRRDWQPSDSWTPRPPRPYPHSGPRPGGPRPGDPRPGGYGGPRPGGPRPGGFGGYGSPRPGPRPGDQFGPRLGPSGPRSERTGFGFSERRPDAAPHRPQHQTPRNFDELPPEAESLASADFSEPIGEIAPPTPPSPRPPRRPDYRARSGGFPDRRPFRPGAAPQAGWSRPPVAPPSAGLLGEDEELVAGRHPVEEAFVARREAHRLLVVPQRRQALERLVLHATNLRIPIVEIEGGTLTSLAGFDGHQGIALVTDRRQFAGLDDLIARAIERKEPPFVLVLDSLEDPQNFGSLLRTAEASGVHGVVYPTHRQAPLSAAAVKASAGAVEHLLLVPVEDLAEALTDLHIRGLRILGSDADAPLTARQADLRGPVAIVVGSEGQGLGPAVRRRCDTVVRIPMRGRVTSLNASVAGSILLYEASSQRGGERPLLTPELTDADSDAIAELGRPAEATVGPGPEEGVAVAEPSASAEPGTSIAPPEVEPKPRRRASARTRTAPGEPAAGAPAEPPSAPAQDDLPPGGLGDDVLLPGGPAVAPAPTEEPR